MRGRISFTAIVLAAYAFLGAMAVGTWLTGANRRNKKTCHN